MRVDSSGQLALAVTPSDTLNIVHPSGQTFTKGLYIGAPGNLSVVMAGGGTTVFTAIAGGVIHPLSVQRVNATGTTATGIVALY